MTVQRTCDRCGAVDPKATTVSVSSIHNTTMKRLCPKCLEGLRLVWAAFMKFGKTSDATPKT